MFAIVPYVVAFFAPLQAASAPPIVAPGERFVQIEYRVGALDPEQLRRVLLAYALPAPPVPVVGQITVPDESRTRFDEFGTSPRLRLLLPYDASVTTVTNAPPPPESLYVRVRKQVRDQSLAPAVAASLLVASAVENERVGHHNLAREDLELALERDPTHAEALRMRASRRYDAGDYRGALRDAEAHLASRPASRSARYERANLLVWCGRPVEAHRELTALIRENPGRAEYYVARAAAAFQLGHDEDGDLDSELAVELAPADPSYRLFRMKNRLAARDLAGAYDQYRAGFRAGDSADPAAVRVQVELLTLAYQNFGTPSDRSGEFMVALDTLTKTCPESNPPRHLLAAEFLRASRPDLAERVATEALDRDPVDARAFHLRGQARAALARPDAVLDFATALGLDDAAETRAELVKLHRAAGRHAEARDLAVAGVESHPECGACRQFLAGDDLRRGDFASAERHATCALWLARDRSEAAAARLTRGLARLAQGDLPGAAADFAALPTIDADAPAVTLPAE